MGAAEIVNTLSPMFQFHTGSIESGIAVGAFEIELKSFNSTLVRLRDAVFAPERAILFGFNSTLVRLRETPAATRRPAFRWFQFHTGSIESRSRTASRWCAPPAFQFHTGSIESPVPGRLAPGTLASFNSTLVRLRGRR